MISVITVCYNAKSDLQKTISSICSQTFQDFEFVVIDGDSSDGSIDVIRSETRINRWISESDTGIYDAMNKGLRLAANDWVLFMNAGDVFAGSDTLYKIAEAIQQNPNTDIIYGDILVLAKRSFRMACDHHKRVFHHQAIIYKKSLHNSLGYYVENRAFTIADYFFFLQCLNLKWVKMDLILAKIDAFGVSSKYRTFYMKIYVDFLFGYRSAFNVVVLGVIYPLYRIFKTLIRSNSFYEYKES